MSSTEVIFRKMISLVGSTVEVGLRSTGEKLSGRVAYAMFDSFLMDGSKGRTVVPFSDILYLDPVE